MKKKIDLTSKIYLIEFLSGMVFYSLGVMLVTPPTTPEIIKPAAIGLMVFILLAIISVTIFTNSEKLDERAKINLYKASNMTLLLILILFLIGGAIIRLFMLNVMISPGILSFILATVLIVHSSTFRTLEILGK